VPDAAGAAEAVAGEAPPHATPLGVPAVADVPLRPAEFAEVARRLSAAAGIQLRDGKEGLVRSRLARRLRQLGDPSYRAYLDRARADPAELAHMVDLLTTNKTAFFREPAHFDALAARVLPAFAAAPGGLRVWSAGCSTGEEPYTLAMVLGESLGGSAGALARVLATDISARALARARAGVYADPAGVGPERLARHFVRRPDGAWAAGANLRRAVRFASLNLVGPWPMRGPLHAVFCRNVMIYFDKPTQAALVARFEALLAPGGYLFVGHAESLGAVEHGLAYVQPAVYRKPA
jgi:chemotaxis protein methyltransferase CheR